MQKSKDLCFKCFWQDNFLLLGNCVLGPASHTNGCKSEVMVVKPMKYRSAKSQEISYQSFALMLSICFAFPFLV